MDTLFAPDFRAEPYWWEAAPRPKEEAPPLPAQADVAIVGSGFTGLSAALRLARAGRSVIVLDAEDAGAGASSRNAGFLGRVLKHDFGHLVELMGLDRAIAIYREMQAAFDAVGAMVEREAIQCHYRICGRVMVARNQRQYDALGHELELRQKHLGHEFAMLPGAALAAEISSPRFVGGALIPELGSIHPGLYHLGILAKAREAGAAIHPRTQVTAIAPERPGEIRLQTSRGVVAARNVVVATNGYTGPAHPWIQRRVIPFNAFMVATTPLPTPLIERLLPKHRTYIDCNFNVDAYRRSPDSTRILYCGKTGMATADPRRFAARLKAGLADAFPELAEVPLSRAWTGRCAGTFDYFPHIGARDGVHYAMGYCFAGVPMGTYLGGKVAGKILGEREAATIFDSLDFPSHPLYAGNPWFVPLAMKYFDWKDRAA